MNNFKVSAMLGSYRALNEGLYGSSETDLYQALEIECTTKRRKTVLKRLIQKLAVLKQQEIKRDLIDKYL
jgi:hypothetical protein